MVSLIPAKMFKLSRLSAPLQRIMVICHRVEREKELSPRHGAVNPLRERLTELAGRAREWPRFRIGCLQEGGFFSPIAPLQRTVSNSLAGYTFPGI